MIALIRALLRRRGRLVLAGVRRRAELGLEVRVVRGGVALGPGQDLRAQQVEHQAILVRGPQAPVAAQERRPRALLAGEPHRPVGQAAHEPLEADGHLDQRAIPRARDPIEDRARDDRLAERRAGRPPARVEEVVGANREEMVGRDETAGARDDAVTVGVGVISEREVEALPDRQEVGHREGRRAIGSNLAVVIERDKPERGVDAGPHDLEVQAVAFGDRVPSSGRSHRPSGPPRGERRSA